MATENKRMRQLNATEAEWQVEDPTILDGEIAFSSDVQKFKVGPGKWSTLTYWESSSIPDAPMDGYVYGLKDQVWTPTPEFDKAYSGDLNFITNEHVKFVALVAPIINGWNNVSDGDYVLHMGDVSSGFAIQIGYHYSADGQGQTAVYTRVNRGTWSEWITNSAFSQEPYIGSLTAMANSSEPYDLTAVVGTGATGGWTDMSPGDVVQVVNIDAASAQMIGYSTGATQSDMQMWLRRKEGGNWGVWNRPQVLMDDISNLDVYTKQQIHDLFVDIGGDVMTGFLSLHADPTLDAHAATKKYVDDQDEAQTFIKLTDTPTSYNTAQRLFARAEDITVPTKLEFHPVLEQDIADLDRMRHRHPYVFGTEYLKNDRVLDGDWTMIANKTTTERAAPQEDNNQIYDMVDIPGFLVGQFTGTVKSGREYTNTEAITLVGYQVWLPTLTNDTSYTIRVFSYPEGRPEDIKYKAITDPQLQADAWSTIAISQTLITKGTVFGIEIIALNSGSSSIITGGWTRTANNNTLATDPGTAGWGTSNSDSTLRINYVDADTVDRKTELNGIVVGTVIQFVNTADPAQSMTWTINGLGVDQGSHISFDNVTYDGAGAAGVPAVGTVTTMTADVPVASPTDYAHIVGGNPTHSWGTSIGMLEFEGVPQAGADANAYGVRVLADTWTASVDWDISGLVGKSGVAGSGGDAGVTRFIDLTDTPGSYLNNQGKIPIVKTAEDGLDWYIPGGVNSLPILTDISKGTTGGGGAAPDQAAIALNNTDYATFLGNPPDFGWNNQQQDGTGMIRIDPENAVYVGFDGVLYTYIGPRKVYVGLVPVPHTIPPEYADYSTYVVQAVDLVAIATSDHSLLAGLDADDHPQYLTNARGDSRYLPTTGGTMTGDVTWIVGSNKVVIGDRGIGFGNDLNQYGGIIEADIPATMGSTWNFMPNDLNNVWEYWHRLYFDDGTKKWGIRQGASAADNAADISVDEIATVGSLSGNYLPLTATTSYPLTGSLAINRSNNTDQIRLMRAVGTAIRIAFDTDTFANEAAHIEWDEPNKRFDFWTANNAVNIGRIEADPLAAAPNDASLMTRAMSDLRNVVKNGVDQTVNERFFVFDGSQSLTLGGSYIQFPAELATNLPQVDGSINFNANRGLMVFRTTQPGEQIGQGAYTVLDTANIKGANGIVITGHDPNEEGATAITFSFDADSSPISGAYLKLEGGTTVLTTAGPTVFTQNSLLVQNDASSSNTGIRFQTTAPSGADDVSSIRTATNGALMFYVGPDHTINTLTARLNSTALGMTTDTSIPVRASGDGRWLQITNYSDPAGVYLPLVGGTMTGAIVLHNTEPTNLTVDGEFGFDASRGLLVYRTQMIGDETVAGGFTVLDGSNIAATGGITIANTEAAQVGTTPITFGFDPTVAGGPWLPLAGGLMTGQLKLADMADGMRYQRNANYWDFNIHTTAYDMRFLYNDILTHRFDNTGTPDASTSVITRAMGDTRYALAGSGFTIVASADSNADSTLNASVGISASTPPATINGATNAVQYTFDTPMTNAYYHVDVTLTLNNTTGTDNRSVAHVKNRTTTGFELFFYSSANGSVNYRSHTLTVTAVP